jgi:hypothetical protein
MTHDPIGTRFAPHERADGTVICVIRTGARDYGFEWRDALGQWWHLHFRRAGSHDAALRDIDRLAKYSDAKWRDACRNTHPSHYPQ